MPIAVLNVILRVVTKVLATKLALIATLIRVRLVLSRGGNFMMGWWLLREFS
jgi:hypothetical protein